MGPRLATLKALINQALLLRELTLRGAIKGVKARNSPRSLSLVCPNIRLLNIKDLKGVSEVEIKTQRESGEVIVVNGERKVKVTVWN